MEPTGYAEFSAATRMLDEARDAEIGQDTPIFTVPSLTSSTPSLDVLPGWINSAFTWPTSGALKESPSYRVIRRLVHSSDAATADSTAPIHRIETQLRDLNTAVAEISNKLSALAVRVDRAEIGTPHLNWSPIIPTIGATLDTGEVERLPGSMVGDDWVDLLDRIAAGAQVEQIDARDIALKALASPDGAVRSAAADALVKVAGATAVHVLQDAMKIEKNTYVRAALASALEAVGP